MPNALQPDAKGIAEAVIREAAKTLVASHSDYARSAPDAVARTLGTLCANSSGGRPHIVEQHHLFVALAQAVLLQSQQIDALTRELDTLRMHANELGGRTVPARDRLAELELAQVAETVALLSATNSPVPAPTGAPTHGRFGPPAHPNGGLGE